LASKAETCPECGNESLSILPGAKRASCTLCHYSPPNKGEPIDAPFQGFAVDRRQWKRNKSINLSPVLLILLVLVGGYFGYQKLSYEPEELDGLRALERSYRRVNRMITAEALQTTDSQDNLRHLIQRENAVVSHLNVSSCLNAPRIYLSNVYGLFDKNLANHKPNFRRNHQVISLSSKFVNGAMKCRDNFAPNQHTSLRLYTDYPEFDASKK